MILDRIRKPEMANIVNIIQAIVLSATIVAFNVYSLLINESNHTGFNTSLLIVFFLLAFFINLADLAAMKKMPVPGINKRLMIVVVALAIIGTLNISLFDHYHIMMQYDRWIASGMPPKP